jgi:uncharacterized protein
MLDLDHGIEAYEASDFAKAFEILMPLAETGEPQAQKVIAHMYSFAQGVPENSTEAIKWYRLAAEQGDPVAQNNLASHLIEENIEEAIRWYIASAEKGFPFAEEVLGDIYSGNLIFSGSRSRDFRDDLEAAKWYEKAAKKGFPIACHRLGYIYSSSQLIMDKKKAIKWYEEAAQKDYAPSQLVLSEAYQKGLLGLSQDQTQAEYWLEKSKSNL